MTPLTQFTGCALPRKPVQSIPEAARSHCIYPLGFGTFLLKCRRQWPLAEAAPSSTTAERGRGNAWEAGERNTALAVYGKVADAYFSHLGV